MYILWIILAVAFLAVEFGTVTLVSFWFVVGSLAALGAFFLGAALWLQVLVFALVSLLMLLLLRPFLRKYVDPLKVPTNVDAMVGKEALVTEAINNLEGVGTVKLNGLTWSARSEDGSEIPVDTVVSVRTVEGVKLIVKPV
ncbi:MAG: NfeD family protein [Oscillospiraceae bacterium]|jgi:membrane protein implicated in regulation of membrane protease activity|nr:NfeD family protein [Oscillospiraceae bacterium]MBR4193996.1 NfeD family protein [Oscillospiraceae bacterium]MBR4656146.1 NfeD family protein [Oscillospiraceae bacterium]